MTKVVDAAYQLHNRQLEAATQIQDLVIKAVDGLVTLRHKAPQPPERVAEPLNKITAPIAARVGGTREFNAYFARTTRDWIQLQRRFQDAVFKTEAAPAEAITAESTTAEPTPAPAATKRVTPKPAQS